MKSDDPWPVDEFLVTGYAWLIGPWPRPGTTAELCRDTARIGFTGADGVDRECVPVLTELLHAERFVEAHSLSATHKPFTTPTKQEFADLLEELARHGNTHVGLDPGFSNVRYIPIARFVEGIRNRPR